MKKFWIQRFLWLLGSLEFSWVVIRSFSLYTFFFFVLQNLMFNLHYFCCFLGGVVIVYEKKVKLLYGNVSFLSKFGETKKLCDAFCFFSFFFLIFFREFFCRRWCESSYGTFRNFENRNESISYLIWITSPNDVSFWWSDVFRLK